MHPINHTSMYRILISFTFFFGFFQANAQSLCLGNDTTVCAGSPLTINDCSSFGGGSNASTSPYVEGQIPYNPDPFNVGTAINLSDDAVSSAINIGFNFCFFGNDYTQFYIGSNGWISFSPGQSTSFTSGPIPNTAPNIPKNCIMGPWQDWHPGTGPNVGNYIRYQVLGTAPYRRLVVSWNQVPFFSCTTTYGTFQIIIFETTNIIETQIQNKPACLTWAGGTATHGLHNLAGNFAYVVPGRNSTQWTTTNEGWRFTPGAIFEWQNTLGQTFPYNGGVLNIPSVSNGTVGYFLTYAGSTCAANSGLPSDTSWVTGVTLGASATATDDICSAGLGTVTGVPAGGQAPYTYNWPGLGNANTATVTGVTAGTYTVEITDAIGCTATANVTVGDTPAQYTSSSTEVSCPGGSDGTATADMVPQIGTVSYLWDDPLAQTTSTATGLSAGTYTCTISSNVGCSTTVSVTVTEIPGMTATIASQSDVTCNSGDDGMITVSVAQGTAPYSYSWDNSTSTTNVADDLAAGTHTCTITDANGCVITISGTINEPPALAITSLTPDTQICPEDEITLTVSGTGGSSAYTFTWFENGTAIGTGNSITVDPENTNTQYCVELSEACGSPTDQQCMTVSFPTPIIPSALPDEAQKCVPNHFLFTNTSSNPGEIATTFWEFNDHPDHNALVNGADTISHYFDQIGTHTITMTITSIYGCVYTDTLVDLIEALPSPTAAFGFSANPATVFETVIQMQNQSSLDVVHWQWVSPYSNPISSNQENPVFTFPEGEAGVYPVTLYVTTDYGCTDSVTIDLHVIEDILFYAPNAFTPDGDEFNQSWKPEIMGIDIYDFELLMFNRWGEVIWESHDPNVGWDGTYNGKLVPAGTYVWTARVKSPMNDDKKTFTGSVVILK